MQLRGPAPIASIPVLLLAVLHAAPAESQSVPSPYRFIDTRHEATVYAGSVATNRGVLRLGPGGGFLVGARYGYEISGPAAVEIAASYLLADREVYDPSSTTQPPAFVGTADQHVVLLEGRFRFGLTGARTWYNLAPFLYAGGGLALGSSPRTGVENELGPGELFTFGPSATAGLGGGVRWMPHETIGLRIEAGTHLWKVGNPPAFRAREELIGPVSDAEWPRWSTLVLGISYRF